MILMDLAASSAFGQANGPHVDLQFDEPGHLTGKEGQWSGYARTGEVGPTRYCLNICGHGPCTYPVLEDLNEQFDKLFQHSLGCAHPEFAKFAEEMEHAIERVELEE